MTVERGSKLCLFGKWFDVSYYCTNLFNAIVQSSFIWAGSGCFTNEIQFIALLPDGRSFCGN